MSTKKNYATEIDGVPIAAERSECAIYDSHGENIHDKFTELASKDIVILDVSVYPDTSDTTSTVLYEEIQEYVDVEKKFPVVRATMQGEYDTQVWMLPMHDFNTSGHTYTFSSAVNGVTSESKVVSLRCTRSSDSPWGKLNIYTYPSYSPITHFSDPWVHTITSDDLTGNKEFYVWTSNEAYGSGYTLSRHARADGTMVEGDIHGLRYIRENTGHTISSTDVEYIEIFLCDVNGDPITTEVPIRKIDSSELIPSDNNSATYTRDSRFHFSHFGTCGSNMQEHSVKTYYLKVKFKLAANTTLQVDDKIQLAITYIEF